jgi:mannitol/fructose-specific phosphotransferase system IIA component (Ntr-type)
MATLDRWLDTQVVMLLSITNPQAQVNLLQEVIDFFSTPGALERVLQCTDAQAMAAVLAGRFSNEQKVVQG